MANAHLDVAASQAIKEQVLGSVLISPRGGMMTQALAGGIVARAQASRASNSAVQFTSRMWLVLGPTMLGIFEFKRGFVRTSLGRTILIVPKRDVVSFELSGRVLTQALTIQFADGGQMKLEVPRGGGSRAKKISGLLRSAR